MTHDNVEILRDQYAATNERDFARAMSHYADDVQLVVPADDIRGGTFTGRAAVGRWFGDWFSTFDRDARFEIEQMIPVDERSLLLIAAHHARGRASGAQIKGDVVWLYQFQDGKITHIQGFASRDEGLEAVGLAP